MDDITLWFNDVFLFLKSNGWSIAAVVAGVGWARYYLKSLHIKKCYKDCKRERDKCREVCAALEEELTRIKAVRSFKHWLYLPSDTVPRTLICHKCYGDGPPRRMEPKYTQYMTVYKDVDTTPTLSFICHHCRTPFEAGDDQAKIEAIMNGESE